MARLAGGVERGESGWDSVIEGMCTEVAGECTKNGVKDSLDILRRAQHRCCVTCSWPLALDVVCASILQL